MEENKRTIAYSQHYRSAQEFIGTPADQVVFQYIWDEWLCRYRQGKNTSFQLSINKLSQRRQMHRNTIRLSLDRLIAKKLIEIDDAGLCTLNVDYFIELAGTYECLNVEARMKFVKALEVGNLATSSPYDCTKTGETYEILEELRGGLYKNVQPCTNMYNPVQICTSENGENEESACTNLYNLVQICTTLYKNVQPLMDDFFTHLKENFTPESVYVEICPFLEGVMDEKSALECIERLVWDGGLYKNVQLGDIPVVLALTCTNLYRGLYKNVQVSPKTCTNLYNSKRNINKENKLGLEWEREYEREEEFDEDFPDDEEKEEEVNLAVFDSLNCRYEKIQKRRRLPFIPVREVEEAINNLPAFLDRPEMIFIHQLYEILSELFVGETLNDKDEWVEVKQDPEGMTISTDRIMQDLLIPAYESTKYILDSGKFCYKGAELPVSSDKKFEPEDLELLIDWQLSSDRDGRHYVISKARFKNIYSQEVEEKNRRLSAREGREQDKDYMRQIIKLGDNEEDYDKLTDIELVAYNFLVENFDISEDLQTFSPRFPYINQLGLTRFYHSFRGNTVTPQDFLGILYNNAPDRNDGSLILKPRTFSAQAIIEWNQKHTQISAILPLDE